MAVDPAGAGYVGRQREVAALTSAVDAAVRDRGGRIVLVRGAAGSGKSTLLGSALDAVRRPAADAGPGSALDRHVVVVRTGCLPANRRLPLSLLGALLPQPEGYRGPWGESDQLVALDALGDSAPVVVAIDDLHWADERSLEVLEPWLRAISARPVTVLATARLSDLSPSLVRVIVGLTDHGSLDELVLEPLDETATGLLARRLLRPSHEEQEGDPAPPVASGEMTVPDAVAGQLGHTGGNPVLVADVVTSATDYRPTAPQPPADAGAVPEWALRPHEGVVVPTLADEADLPRMSHDARELIVLASMLGSRFEAGDLCIAAGRTMTELLPAVRELLAAGLVVESGADLSVASERLRHQLHAELPRSVRAELHRDLARRLDDAGADATTVAGQLLAADVRRPDLDWVADVATRTSRQAPGVGIALWHRVASESSPGDALSWQAAEATAGAHLAAGQLSLAKAVARRALSVGRRDLATPGRSMVRTGVAGDHQVRLQRIVAAALIGQGRWEVARTSAEVAADEPGLSDAARIDLLAMAGLGSILGRAPARAVETAERAARLQAAVNPSAVRPALAVLRAELHHRQGDLGRARDLLGAALVATGSAGEATALELAVHVRLAMALADLDRPDEARRVLDAADQAATRQGSTAAARRSRLTRAEVDFLTGELGRTVGRPPGDDNDEALVVGRSLMLGRRALVALHRQGPTAGMAWLDRVPADLGAASEFAGLGWLFRTRAMVRLALGDEQRWYDELAAGWRHCRDADLQVDLVVVGVELADAAIRRNDPALADEVVGRLESLAGRNPDVPWLQASALTAAGLAEGDPDLLLHGVEIWRASPRALQAARATERTATRLTELGRSEEADDLAAAAVRGYVLAGAEHDASRLRAGLRASSSGAGAPGGPGRGVGEQPTVAGWENLTRTERLVAGFVEQGESNAAIAERLVVSRRTVESHVSHILGKLGVRSRAELILAAARRAESGEVEDPGAHG